MKFAGFCGLLLAVAMPVTAWLAYADMARLHETGSEGTLKIHSKIGEIRGRKSSVTRVYDATVADVRVKVTTGGVLEADTQIPVLYLPQALHGDRPTEYFRDGAEYIAGRKSDTKSQILIREMGWPSIWIFITFEVAVLACSLLLLSKKMPNQLPETTRGK